MPIPYAYGMENRTIRVWCVPYVYGTYHTRTVPGEVLVLLPTSSNKLLAQWQGPNHVSCRVGEVDYEVYMPDKRKRKAVFHINMLKKWHSPEATCFWMAEDEGSDEEEFVPTGSVRVVRLQP